jgi:hypothetical protein
MDSRRSKLLAVSLVVLSLASIGLYVSQSGERTRAIERNDFALAETENVNRVQLLRSSDTVDLTFDGRWQVNNQWGADVQMIKVLMATLKQVAPHRPVAAAQQDSVVARLKKTGTRVRVMEDSAVVREFWVGGNSNKSEAWFVGEDNRAIVMIIPGYRVYVSGIFELPAGGWRNKRVFDFNWRNFRTLTTTYTKQPAEGFTIELKQRYFGIRNVENIDTTRLNDYLDGVSLLMAKRFLDKKTSDGIRLKQPEVRIDIEDITKRTYSLELFAPGQEGTEVYGRLASGELVVFDGADISAIVKGRSFFVKSK